jgi:hypothetical protein
VSKNSFIILVSFYSGVIIGGIAGKSMGIFIKKSDGGKKSVVSGAGGVEIWVILLE